jgi:hypothetical protein
MSSETEPAMLDEHLWELVQAAVPAVKAKIAEHVVNGDYVSTVKVPKFSTFDSGWPRMDWPTWGAEEAYEYSMLFVPGRRKGSTAFEDVPELMTVIEYLLGDPERAARIRFLEEDPPLSHDGKRIFDQMFAAEIVLDVVDRVYALGAQDDPQVLRQAYAERERAFFATELSADIVAPLIMTNLDLNEPLDIGKGVRIERLDEATIRAAARDRYVVEAVTPMVSDAATHAIVVTGVVLEDTSRAKRLWDTRTRHRIDLSKVDTAVGALRVVTEIETGYAQVFLRPHDWAGHWTYDLPPVERIGTYRRYPTAFDHFGWLRARPVVSVEKLSQLPAVHTAMYGANAATKLAVRRLSMANLRESSDDKLVDACIGIEALLSADSAEISHKIATRGAAALALYRHSALNPTVTFRMFKTVYNRRSNIVHGVASDRYSTFDLPGSKPISTVALASYLLRELLLSKLASDTPWTIESLDADMLSAYLPIADSGAQETDAEGRAQPGNGDR